MTKWSYFTGQVSLLICLHPVGSYPIILWLWYRVIEALLALIFMWTIHLVLLLNKFFFLLFFQGSCFFFNSIGWWKWKFSSRILVNTVLKLCCAQCWVKLFKICTGPRNRHQGLDQHLLWQLWQKHIKSYLYITSSPLFNPLYKIHSVHFTWLHHPKSIYKS